ncbi:MAG: transposase domain-containing protein [Cypionkella sp.]
MSPALTPSQLWWTAGEIAGAGLPDLPASKRGVNLIADRLGWRGQVGLARRREGRGGGWEYSWQLFPNRAKQQLLATVAPVPEAAKSAFADRDEAWAWFEKLKAPVQDKARVRLAILQQVEALEPVQGMGRHIAVQAAARASGVGVRTVWSWFAMVEGVRSDDRLPYLAPRHMAAAERPRSKDCDPDFFAFIKGDFLRLGAIPFTDSYRRAVRAAKKQGWAILPERTMRRRLDAAISEPMQVLMKQGIDAVKIKYPVQTRDKTAMVPLEAVNADFHKFDVFVRWPGVKEPMRPQMVAFQDIYSGRILAWRLDQTPNSTAVLLCAGDMIETWGIPEHVLLDNGREFAAKAITGGAATRYRFKVKEDDIPGLFTGLGCKIHWATPYSGQSKPIERAFRDMCTTIAQDPRFDGAWTGNTIAAKPENYGSRAIPLEDFLRVLGEGIEEHNTRQGRRSEVAWGRSFAEVFDEAYANSPIRKATEAQRRLWLMGAENIRADTNTGAVWFQGNEFWAEWMHQVAGKRVIIRFDPAAFWDGIHVYSADNAYLGHADVRQKVGFFDADEARAHARARNDWLRAEKAKVAALGRYTALQIGEFLDDAAPNEPARPESKVVKGIFGKPDSRKAVRQSTSQPAPEDVADMQASIVADLAARRNAQGPTPEETARDRFKRALDLERAMEAGREVTREQQRWLSQYQTGDEYRGERGMWMDFGEAYLG